MDSNTLIRDIYPYILLIWLTYLEIIVSKIWKNEKLTQLSSKFSIFRKITGIITTNAKQDSEQNDLLTHPKKIENQMIEDGIIENHGITKTAEIFHPFRNSQKFDPATKSEFESSIPNEHFSSPVFANNKENKVFGSPVMGSPQMGSPLRGIMDFKSPSFQKISSHLSSKQSINLKLRIPNEDEEEGKMRQWFKIEKFYDHYNLFIQLNWILHSEVSFELVSLGIVLWSYNLLSTVSSLLYLLVIGVLCFYKTQGSKLIFYKNFCLILFNVKYVTFLVFFHIIDGNMPEKNLADILAKQKKLPTSYFSIGISDQEFYVFLLLFLILFLLEIYFILNLKIARYVSSQLQRSIKEYFELLGSFQKKLDYEQWENKSNRLFIDIQAAFFQYFDQIIVLTVGFFAISDFYFFNLVIFGTCAIYLFIMEFETGWKMFNDLDFKSWYFNVLMYFSFLSLFVNHVLIIPQVSNSCEHFLCGEIGSRADKLYNIFIIQTFITLLKMSFYGDFPEFLKIQAFRVIFHK